MKILYSIFFFCFVFNFLSCQKKEEDDCPLCPSVQSLAPDSGRFNDTVTIYGVNFNNSFQDNIVKFNGTQVDRVNILSGNSSQLVVKVPKGCGPGPVTVDVDVDLIHNGISPVFNYIYNYSIAVVAGVPQSSGDVNTTLLSSKLNSPGTLAINNSGNIYTRTLGIPNKIKYIDFGNDMVSTLSSDPLINGYLNDFDVNNSNEIYATGFFDTIYSNVSIPHSQFSEKLQLDSGRRGARIEFDEADNLFVSALLQPTTYSIIKMTNSSRTNILYGNNQIISFTINNDNLYYLGVKNLFKVDLSNGVTTKIREYPTSLPFCLSFIAADSKGNVYVAHSSDNQILKINSSGIVSVLAGSMHGIAGCNYENDLSQCLFNNPKDIVVDEYDNIYFSDMSNHCILKITIE